MMLSATEYKYGAFGPGGGSVPAYIMRSGQFAPFSAMSPRHDIETQWVQDQTSIPVGQPAPAAPAAVPAPVPVAGYFGDFGAIDPNSIWVKPTTLYAAHVGAGALIGILTGVMTGTRRWRNAGIGAAIGAVVGIGTGAYSAAVQRTVVATAVTAALPATPKPSPF